LSPWPGFACLSWPPEPKLYLKTWGITSHSPRLGLSLLCHHGGPSTRPTPLGLGANPCRRACHTCFSKIRALKGRAKCWPHFIKSLQPNAFLHIKHVWDYFFIFFTIHVWYHGYFLKIKLGGILKNKYLSKLKENFLFKMCLYNPNGFRTETMYVYYIIMKIYVLDCKNIFSTFYCLCITICLPILLSWTKHKHQPFSKQKPFKTKTLILANFSFI